MTAAFTRRELGIAAGASCAAALLGHPADAAPPAVGAPIAADDPPAREASWYRKLPEGRVECQLCPRGCQVADAERGGCGARENRGGTYTTLVYGSACALHIDPIEKKPFFHVLPGAQALSYATAGCNVECKFCQNWEISQFRPEQVRSAWWPPEALAKAARQRELPLLAATYSEPAVFWEYVRDTAAAGRGAGVRSVVVSNGYIQETPLKEVLPLLAAVKVDLKAFSERFYREVVRGELKPVLKTLEVIRAGGVWLEVVVLLIPGLNDSEGEVRALVRWVRATLGTDVPLHFTRFHPTYRLTNLPPTPLATLERSWQIAKDEGLAFPYLGNVPGHAGESTYCPGCGHRLVHRIGFEVVENTMAGGRCPRCGRTIPGVWS